MGERCDPGRSGEPTEELAEKLRLLAAVDPELAREFVAELVATLDRSTGGRFAAELSPNCRAALGLSAGQPAPPA